MAANLLLHTAGKRLTSTAAALASGAMSLSPKANECSFHLKDGMPADRDPRAIISAFRAVINMSVDEVESWLGTPESRLAVEQVAEDADKEGRHAARRIVELLCKDDELFYEGDLQHMYQITQYINCHRNLLQQRVADGLPAEELRSSFDRYHLCNFGFDILKELSCDPGTGSGGSGDKAAMGAAGGLAGAQQPSQAEDVQGP